jgi:hypothetical protein
MSIPRMSAILNRLNRKTVHVSVRMRRVVLIVALTLACGCAAGLFFRVGSSQAPDASTASPCGRQCRFAAGETFETCSLGVA